MKKRVQILMIALLASLSVQAQKLITKEGVIEIFSETSLFTIEAKNQTVASILDPASGDVVASTLVRSFKFREALVEEHFNENYMESHRFPKSVFQGKITNNDEVDYNVDGTYKVNIEGDLTLHGVTKPLKTSGTISVRKGKISANTEFNVSLAAYSIKIESKYKNRIDDSIKLTVHFEYDSM